MAPRSITEERFLTTKQLATLLSMSKSYFEKGRVYGYGPTFLKLNGKVLYRLSDVEAWLDAQRR